jgi:hypothetical protein
VKSRCLLSVGAILSLLAGDFAVAQAYKWTDENGKVHFSDSPPPDRKAERLTIKPAVPADPNAKPGRSWESQLEESRMGQLRSQQQKDVEERKARAAENECHRARYQLDLLQNSRRVYRVDDQGQRQYVDDKDRPAQIQSAQQAVDKYCR